MPAQSATPSACSLQRLTDHVSSSTTWKTISAMVAMADLFPRALYGAELQGVQPCGFATGSKLTTGNDLAQRRLFFSLRAELDAWLWRGVTQEGQSLCYEDWA